MTSLSAPLEESKIHWPDSIDYIAVSFISKDQFPLSQLIKFSSRAIEEIEQQCKVNSCSRSLVFSKAPIKYLITDKTDEVNVTDVYRRISSVENSNLLFILIVYPPADEGLILKLERKLTLDKKFAVAVVDSTYVLPQNSCSDPLLGRNKIEGLRRISKNIVEDMKEIQTKRASDRLQVQRAERSMDSSFTSTLGVDQSTASSSAGSVGDETPPAAPKRFEPFCKVPIPHTSADIDHFAGGVYNKGISTKTPVETSIITKKALTTANGVPVPTNNASSRAHRKSLLDSTALVEPIRIESPPKPSFAELYTPPPAFKPVEFQIGEFYDIVVSHVNESGDFFVQLCSQGKYIDFMTMRMQLLYLSLAEADFALPMNAVREVADLSAILCAAPYTVDSSCPTESTFYFRASLLRRVSATVYEVLFLDYGNKAVVPFNKLKILPESFRRVGGFAIHCRLSGVQEPINAALLRQKTATNDYCVMQVNDLRDLSLLQVSLFLTDGRTEENLNNYMKAQTLATQPQRMVMGRGRSLLNH